VHIFILKRSGKHERHKRKTDPDPNEKTDTELSPTIEPSTPNTEPPNNFKLELSETVQERVRRRTETEQNGAGKERSESETEQSAQPAESKQPKPPRPPRRKVKPVPPPRLKATPKPPPRRPLTITDRPLTINGNNFLEGVETARSGSYTDSDGEIKTPRSGGGLERSRGTEDSQGSSIPLEFKQQDTQKVDARIDAIKSSALLILAGLESFPWWCIFISYAIMFALSAISTIFILLYCTDFSSSQLDGWLLSCLLSLLQDFFINQPIVITLRSIAMEAILKRYM